MVQTFLPYANFEKSAKTLDNKRLYKQIVECKQLLLAVYAHDNGCIYYCDEKYHNETTTHIYQHRNDEYIYLTPNPSYTILNKFGKPKKVGWQQHLAAKQWFGYYDALRLYQIIMLQEWLRRTWCVEAKLYDTHTLVTYVDEPVMPKWMKIKEYHDSHKRRLFQKDTEYYKEFERFDDGTGYWWPTEHEGDVLFEKCIECGCECFEGVDE